MGLLAKRKRQAEKRKIMINEIKKSGFKDTFLMRKSKAEALITAKKAGVDISKYGRGTRKSTILKDAVKKLGGGILAVEYVYGVESKQADRASKNLYIKGEQKRLETTEERLATLQREVENAKSPKEKKAIQGEIDLLEGLRKDQLKKIKKWEK